MLLISPLGLAGRDVFAGDSLIFDVHEHIVLDPGQTRSLIAVMDRTGIATMVLLGSPDVTFDSDAGFEGYDETVMRQLAMKRQYPDRLRVFYTYPSYDADGPRKAERLAQQGIDGLKFYNGLPMLRDQLGSIDSPAMYSAYTLASERGLPVIIHVEGLQPIQRREFDRVLSDFPRVTFICPHLCGVQSSLEVLGAMLATHPNLFTDGDLGIGWERSPFLRRKNSAPSTWRIAIESCSPAIAYSRTASTRTRASTRFWNASAICSRRNISPASAPRK